MNKIRLAVVAVVLCVVFVAWVMTQSSGAAASSTFQVSPEFHDTSRHADAELSADLRVIIEAAPEPEKVLPAAPVGSVCFHNRVMFQPVHCSKAPEVLSKALEVDASLRRQEWHIVHVGARDAVMKVAELADVFGDASHGGAAVGRMQRLLGQKNFCGPCCECVAAGDYKTFNAPYNATLIVPRHLNVDGLAYLPKEYFVEARRFDLAPSTEEACGSSILSRIPAAVDVLTLDAGRCDVQVVEELAKSSHRPRLLQFTMVADVSYERVINALHPNYTCYFLTTKPEHKKFRGIRQPVYPVAVRVTGCWRGIFDIFKNDRYHTTCVRSSDAALTTVLTAFTRMTHKGLHAGCTLSGRGDRLKRFL